MSSHTADVVEERDMGLEKLGKKNEKLNTIKDKFERFDCALYLNRPRPFIFIRVGRTCPARNSFYKSKPIMTP
jgi:hypothetical protein